MTMVTLALKPADSTPTRAPPTKGAAAWTATLEGQT
jgi:hypothetical protein